MSEPTYELSATVSGLSWLPDGGVEVTFNFLPAPGAGHDRGATVKMSVAAADSRLYWLGLELPAMMTERGEVYMPSAKAIRETAGP